MEIPSKADNYLNKIALDSVAKDLANNDVKAACRYLKRLKRMLPERSGGNV